VNFEITEDLGALESPSGTTTGEYIFKAISNTLENLGFTFEYLVSVITDGTKSMIGCKIGLLGRKNTNISVITTFPTRN